MGIWSFGCIHHASVENQPSADDVGWAGRLKGGRRVGWAEGRRHDGEVGMCSRAAYISPTTDDVVGGAVWRTTT